MKQPRNIYQVSTTSIDIGIQELYEQFEVIHKQEPGLDESYRIYVQQETITITTDHPRGKQYALDTLQQLLSTNELTYGLIEDGPRINMRGIIEGFYGPPWTQEDRKDVLRFLATHRMNTYIYAPKDDPYHRRKWREPYPKEEFDALRELIDLSLEHHLDFIFSISPGIDFNYTKEADFTALFAKIEAILDTGVRDIALLMDDIDYQLSDTDSKTFQTPGKAHAYIANRLFKHIQSYAENTRLLMCPTEYWQHTNSPYRNDLKTEMHPDILVFWTGYKVIAEYIPNIDGKNALEYFGHELVLWDNYPVNDMTRDVIFMGPLVNRGDQLDRYHIGMVSNPMIEWSLSKIPIMTMSDYMWDPSTYDPETSYIKAVQSMTTSTEQEKALLAVLENFRYSLIHYYVNLEMEQAINDKKIDKVVAFYQHMKEAIAVIRTIEDDRFVAQFEPWLQRLLFDGEIVNHIYHNELDQAQLKLQQVPTLKHTVNSNYAMKLSKELGLYDGPLFKKERPNHWR